MTLTLFLALSILGLDFLLYALFQWTYGERRRKRVRRPRTANRPALVRSSVQTISSAR
jgi:hypothetical protein